MTDTTTNSTAITTAQDTDAGVLRFRVASDGRVANPTAAFELARAEEQHRRDQATIDRLTERITHAENEQITDGADSRLERFWERAGRIADAAGYCDEYDRMADELNGTPRERDYDVKLTIQVEYTMTRTIAARSEDQAIEWAQDNLDRSEIAALDACDIEEWEVTDSEAERS